jgi:hypothetical protein
VLLELQVELVPVKLLALFPRRDVRTGHCTPGVRIGPSRCLPDARLPCVSIQEVRCASPSLGLML